jgi:hypothetical protein
MIALVLVGCGKQPVAQTQDPNICPQGLYGPGIDTIEFLSGGNLLFDNDACRSTGTYTCDSANRSLTLTFTAKEDGDGCQDLGTYSCVYEYSGEGFSLRLNITCDGAAPGNKFNPTKSF